MSKQEHLIDIAYEIARKKFKTKPFTFRELYEVSTKSTDKAEMSDLYVDLISDIRFIYIGKDKWTLTENLKNDDFQKISSSMFGLDKYTIEDLEGHESIDDNKKPSDDEDGTIIIEEEIEDESTKDDEIELEDEEEDDSDESDVVIDDIEDLDDDIEEDLED